MTDLGIVTVTLQQRRTILFLSLSLCSKKWSDFMASFALS